ncbi:MAG: type II secretion system F family protein [Propionibacteriaceae bacterium]|nr:type II secretion system F family protein [Propionibacteriaceae bacterium]
MTALQLWVLAGVLVGGGVATLVWYLSPSRPQLAQALARLSPGGGVAADEVAEQDVTARDRLGVWAMRTLPTWLWRGTPTKDLKLLAIPLRTYYGEKVASVAVVLVGTPLAMGLYSYLIGLPPTVPAVGTIAMAFVGWVLPDRRIAQLAAKARLEFRRVLASYADMVALCRGAGGLGTRQSMETAARIGKSWPFERMAAALRQSRYDGEHPWDALADLGVQQHIPELEQLAATLRLAGQEGAQVAANLRERASELRTAITTTDRAEVNAKSERLVLPALVMAGSVVGAIVTPMIYRLLAG